MCLLGWFQHWVILYPKPNEKLNCVTVSFALTVTHGVEQRWHALQRQYGDDYWRTRSDQGQLPAKREVRTMKQTPEVRGAQYVHYKWLNKGFLLEQRQTFSVMASFSPHLQVWPFSTVINACKLVNFKRALIKPTEMVSITMEAHLHSSQY